MRVVPIMRPHRPESPDYLAHDVAPFSPGFLPEGCRPASPDYLPQQHYYYNGMIFPLCKMHDISGKVECKVECSIYAAVSMQYMW